MKQIILTIDKRLIRLSLSKFKYCNINYVFGSNKENKENINEIFGFRLLTLTGK